MKVIWLFVFLLWSHAAGAAPITVIDIAGRTVSLPAPAQKVVLGEGRFMTIFGVLGVADPVSRVAGMMNEFRLYDAAGFARYQRAFPVIDQIPNFGHTTEQSVSIEKILLLNPDVAIFGLDGHGPGAASTHIIQRLEAAKIPVLFIDFRVDPIGNTAKSVELVAKVLGLDAAGAAFRQFHEAELARISQRVAAIPVNQRPTVLFDLRVQGSEECCFTVGKGLFASMAEFVGARSLATNVMATPVGKLSKEFVLSTPFDVYVGTAVGGESDLAAKSPVFDRIVTGAGVTPEQARQSLRDVLAARGFGQLKPFLQLAAEPVRDSGHGAVVSSRDLCRPETGADLAETAGRIQAG
jgi:iron complex transport system substrate-binding protein